MAVKVAVKTKESEKSMFSKIATGAKQKFQKAEQKQAPGAQDRSELDEKIRRKAYDIFVRNGRQHGNDLAHWFEAERQLRA